jgi:hypothetical protein
MVSASPKTTGSQFLRGSSEAVLNGTRSSVTSGLGLGLSIAADCVDVIKGDIRVQSTLGESTTFLSNCLRFRKRDVFYRCLLGLMEDLGLARLGIDRLD